MLMPFIIYLQTKGCRITIYLLEQSYLIPFVSIRCKAIASKFMVCSSPHINRLLVVVCRFSALAMYSSLYFRLYFFKQRVQCNSSRHPLDLKYKHLSCVGFHCICYAIPQKYETSKTKPLIPNTIRC